MTAPTKDPLEFYLASVLGGSLVALLAHQRSLDVSDLLVPNSPDLYAIQSELLDLGLSPRVLACQSLNSLVALFVQEANADFMVTNITNLLWSILGDPENGGQPPEIYRRAGVAMHLLLIGLLTPSHSDYTDDE